MWRGLCSARAAQGLVHALEEGLSLLTLGQGVALLVVKTMRLLIGVVILLGMSLPLVAPKSLDKNRNTNRARPIKRRAVLMRRIMIPFGCGLAFGRNRCSPPPSASI
jgi:hypothetical protein